MTASFIVCSGRVGWYPVHFSKTNTPSPFPKPAPAKSEQFLVVSWVAQPASIIVDISIVYNLHKQCLLRRSSQAEVTMVKAALDVSRV